MKTIILCGGFGTRLREETEYKPKPMVEIGGHPILWHIMKIYSHYGYNDFGLCLGYKGEVIKDYFLKYRSMNSDIKISIGTSHETEYIKTNDFEKFKILLAETGLNTMTGGRIKRVQKYITDDTFMATYGDGVADIDINNLLKFHESHGKIATLSVVHPLSRFGVVDIEGDKVVRFNEKPVLTTWINAGFYVFNKEIFDYIEDDTTVLEKDPLEQLAAEGKLCAYRHKGAFYPMDTYRDYLSLNKLWEEQKAEWKLW